MCFSQTSFIAAFVPRFFCKTYFVLCLLLVSTPSLNADQINTGIDAHTTNQYQQCLKTVNTKDIKQNDLVNINAEVQQFCHSKQRNKAQNLAIDLALKLHQSKAVKRYRYCHEFYYKKQDIKHDLLLIYHVTKLRFVHICDA